ncbi:MAG TPA: tetratricopeptide repeat protein, partial [Chitinophagaceae bacterium]|nr:tetratricopeptide repeat protein [Chitinophagaceae bacterium]
MARRFLYTILMYLLGMGLANSQKSLIDSIRHELRIAPNDTIRLLRYMDLVRTYAEVNPDTSYFYGEKALNISRYLGLRIDEGHAMAEMGYALLNAGNYPRSLQTFIASLAIAEEKSSEQKVLKGEYKTLDEFYDRQEDPHMQRIELIARIRQYMGILYLNAGNFQKSLDNYNVSRDLAEETGNKYLQSIIYSTIGRVYLSLKMPDSAMAAEQHAYDIGVEIGLKKYMGSILLNLARIHAFQGNDSLAQVYFRKARQKSAEQSYFRGVVSSSLFIADYFKRMGNADSSLYYIESALDVARGLNSPDLLLRGYTALADHYKLNRNSDSAVRYQSMIIQINDSLFNSKQAQQFQNIDFDEAQRKQQIETAKASYKEKIRRNLLLAGLGVFLLLAIILWRNSLQRKKANRLLSQQN